ncbi:serine hydrolase domain-containing protein [Ichthyenterobacterium magnum]|uniref:CubicO group peptidase (Beta-lactamase class C family) n=1 Tax=Ichthyenterobacterium magnum TaxID=1230530 RepID=A0A420DGR3_9FLAO|nr:serine hydrolase domain-containing protein [Ichthyenterobacterium magnum]RKE92278.1 CubicO group peptidase (beta-lactamase class C family) [Ichthyenterobacterium magnum]
MKPLIFIIICVILAIQSGQSQTIHSEKLNEYFQVLEENNKFMGSIAIIKNGEIIYQNSVGFSNVEANKTNTDKTKYRVGSISKTFTSTLIMKAVEDDVLSLNQTIDAFFSKIKNADKITVENLLNHSSGIHNFTTEKNYVQYYMTKKSEAEMLELFSDMESDFEPNTKSAYSNTNYVLLSYILQKVYNQSFGEILYQKITKPLHLKDTYFGSTINLANDENYSYRYLGDWQIQNETDTSIPMGAGSIVSTSTDLATFIDALFKEEIVSKESLNTMTTINKGYGFGLIKIPFYDHISYGHNGMIDGFNSSFGYFPEENIGFALTSNGLNYETNEIIITLLNSIFNKAFDIPSFKTVELTSEDLDKYVGTYSCNELPIKFSITKSDNTLMVQATGQSQLPLVAFDNHVFKFDQAGAVFQFYPQKNQMDFKQSGMKYKLTRE